VLVAELVAQVERLAPPELAEEWDNVGLMVGRHNRPVRRVLVLAKASGLGATDLLALARRCDLLRLKGVGSEMVLLLEAAGVKTTADLAKQQPAGLMTAITTANKTAKITEKPPTEPQLADWIDQAKKLPQVLESK
jgi:hypothetical protein